MCITEDAPTSLPFVSNNHGIREVELNALSGSCLCPTHVLLHSVTIRIIQVMNVLCVGSVLLYIYRSCDQGNYEQHFRNFSLHLREFPSLILPLFGKIPIILYAYFGHRPQLHISHDGASHSIPRYLPFDDPASTASRQRHHPASP